MLLVFVGLVPALMARDPLGNLPRRGTRLHKGPRIALTAFVTLLGQAPAETLDAPLELTDALISRHALSGDVAGPPARCRGKSDGSV